MKPIHGVYLNNAQRPSPQETCIVIDDCKIEQFSGHGVNLWRIWLFIIRHSIFMGNKGCGVQINGYDGFVTDNQFAGNGSHGFGCETDGDTVMFTANRVEWNRGYGLYLCGGDTWNVTGNCFDRNWATASVPCGCATSRPRATPFDAAATTAACCPRGPRGPVRCGWKNAAD